MFQKSINNSTISLHIRYIVSAILKRYFPIFQLQKFSAIQSVK